MFRLVLVLLGAGACVAGVSFVIGGGAHWLAIQYGPIASDFIVGTILILLGIVIIAALLAGPSIAANGARQPASMEGAIAALPEKILRSLSPEDLQSLALLCQRRPMLASLVALALGFGVGFDRSHRRR
jgi:hypothetical protein